MRDVVISLAVVAEAVRENVQLLRRKFGGWREVLSAGAEERGPVAAVAVANRQRLPGEEQQRAQQRKCGRAKRFRMQQA